MLTRPGLRPDKIERAPCEIFPSENNIRIERLAVKIRRQIIGIGAELCGTDENAQAVIMPLCQKLLKVNLERQIPRECQSSPERQAHLVCTPVSKHRIRTPVGDPCLLVTDTLSHQVDIPLHPCNGARCHTNLPGERTLPPAVPRTLEGKFQDDIFPLV